MGLAMKDLQKAASNLNIVLGLDPKIKTNVKRVVLEEKIKEAALEVVPSDYKQQDDDPKEVDIGHGVILRVIEEAGGAVFQVQFGV